MFLHSTVNGLQLFGSKCSSKHLPLSFAEERFGTNGIFLIFG